jgi:NAD(P)H dehydrogenase (quinone)
MAKSKSKSGVSKSGVQRVLVVLAHPDDQSFCGSLGRAVCEGLERGGKTFDFVDLYAEGFVASMSAVEHAAYDTANPIVDERLNRYVEMVKSCDALVVVYPTWHQGFPAILKGFFERVMVPGVAFIFNERTGRVRGNLGHIRYFVGVTTYGCPRWIVRVASDMGRRMLTRCLRVMAPTVRARSKWLALYGLNQPNPAAMSSFIERVEQEMVQL